MHGLIFTELKKFADTRLGQGAWPRLQDAAGLRGKLYLAIDSYPDADVVALVTAASEITGQSADALLQDFGEFIAPDLLRMYASILPREWTALDVIENTEETIHAVVRRQNPGAEPPRLECARRSPQEVVVVYSSPRRLCGIAKGIIRGIAKERRQRVTLSEASCMNQGGARCEIVVRSTEA